MTKRKMTKKDEQAQSDRFKQAAKEVGADESEVAFENKLRKLAKAKPPADKGKK